ncbi:MAG: FkbM family methyltransferase [Planctomycetaceae bacterium]
MTSQSVVLDLGGYRGDWADQIHRQYGSQVHVFEPVKSFASGIRDRFASNTAIHVYDFGLGAKTRDEQICLSADASSIFQGEGDSESIRIVDIAEWMHDHAIGHVSLMKVNIEGGEYELLERILDSGLESKFDDIQVQFHRLDEACEERMDRILDRLAGTHEPTFQYRFVWENWRLRDCA